MMSRILLPAKDGQVGLSHAPAVWSLVPVSSPKQVENAPHILWIFDFRTRQWRSTAFPDPS